MKAAGFKLLIAVSLAVHLIIAAALVLRLPDREEDVRPASLTVSLGASGASAGAAQPVSEHASELVESPVEPVEEVREREPEPVRPNLRPRPRPVLREPAEVAEAEQSPRRQARAAPPQVQGREGVTGDDVTQQTVDTDGETDTSGYEAVATSHDDLVLARFTSAKRYPARARMRGREGAVGVEFTLGPDGSVLDARLISPSSHRALDQAALDQVYRAEPFPARPQELDWPSRTYHAEVRFALHDAER